MKRYFIAISTFFFCQQLAYTQQQTPSVPSNAALQNVLETFMDCLKTRDSARFYNLFYDGPVTWVGVYKNHTQEKRKEKDASLSNYKSSDHKTWFRSVSQGSVKEEKFYNVHIETDGNIAALTFDFSYWAGGKKGLWGKESWGLVNINNEWKITSVIFSMEQENILPEPNRN